MLKKGIAFELLRDKKTMVFLFFLVFYLFLGMTLTYPGDTGINLILDADNARVLKDLTEIDGNHWRITVHPLFLLLVQPIVLLLSGMTNDPILAVIILESICAAAMVSMALYMMQGLGVDGPASVCVTMVFGFSFSTMLFSSIPETFIFAGFILMAYTCWVFLLLRQRGSFSFSDWAILILFGIGAFGITLTNFIFYVIGAFVLCLYRFGMRSGLVSFAKIILLCVLAIFCLSIVQHLVWSHSPLFWKSIFWSILGKESYWELHYVTNSLDLDGVIVWAKQFFLYPLIGSHPIETTDPWNGDPFIAFGEYSPISIAALVCFYCVALFCFVSIGRRIFSRKRVFLREMRSDSTKPMVLIIALGWLFNFLLHIIYGSKSAFLYSPHYLFLFMIMLAFALNSITSLYAKRICIAVLISFCVVEAISNLCVHEAIAVIVLGLLGGGGFSVWKVVLVPIVCGGSAVFSIALAKHYLKVPTTKAAIFFAGVYVVTSSVSAFFIAIS